MEDSLRFSTCPGRVHSHTGSVEMPVFLANCPTLPVTLTVMSSMGLLIQVRSYIHVINHIFSLATDGTVEVSEARK